MCEGIKSFLVTNPSECIIYFRNTLYTRRIKRKRFISHWNTVIFPRCQLVRCTELTKIYNRTELGPVKKQIAAAPFSVSRIGNNARNETLEGRNFIVDLNIPVPLTNFLHLSLPISIRNRVHISIISPLRLSLLLSFHARTLRHSRLTLFQFYLNSFDAPDTYAKV